MPNVFQVLVVCTGNVCRSPMGEGILTHLLKDATPPVLVESAGVAAPEGAPASRFSVEVAAEHGISIGGHRARQVTRSLLARADLVLTMEAHHRDEILYMAPSMEGRVEVITEFVGEGPGGVPDPIGADKLIYNETFDHLEGLGLKAAPVILELAAEKASQGPERKKA